MFSKFGPASVALSLFCRTIAQLTTDFIWNLEDMNHHSRHVSHQKVSVRHASFVEELQMLCLFLAPSLCNGSYCSFINIYDFLFYTDPSISNRLQKDVTDV